MVDEYPLFEWSPSIEINETMANYEEDIIMVYEDIPVKHKEKIVKTEMEESNEANDDLKKTY